MLKSFRSSDKKGTSGIEYGDEWYNAIMSKLNSATDVVALLTPRSLERPWILYEAGVAKGKIGVKVLGLAIGVPLQRVQGSGPFYQFQNCGDDEDSLTGLVMQLIQRNPGAEPREEAVRIQVRAFRERVTDLLKKRGSSPDVAAEPTRVDELVVAKLFEEVKTMFRDLPEKIEVRVQETVGRRRYGRRRHFHPMMFEELAHMSGDPSDPVSILMAASFVRDDAPWLYELALEVYRAVKSGDREAIEHEMRRLRRFSELTMRGPFMEEFGLGDKESHILLMEFPRMLEHMLRRTLEEKKPPPRRRSAEGDKS
jgi:hypothetical protein